MVWAVATNAIGPDPGERLMHETGEWAARLLIATLLMSPIRAWTGSRLAIQVRRMLGLYTFFYACLHLLLFMNFYLGWTWSRLLEEIIERPYISVGFFAWLIMLPLAFTSTRAMQRRLRQQWARLHRGIYAVAVLVSLHILWQARSDLGEALVYSGAFAALLLWRLKKYSKYRSKPLAG